MPTDRQLAQASARSVVNVNPIAVVSGARSLISRASFAPTSNGARLFIRDVFVRHGSTLEHDARNHQQLSGIAIPLDSKDLQ